MPLQLAIKPNPAQALNAYKSAQKSVRPGVKLSALLGTNPENKKCALNGFLHSNPNVWNIASARRARAKARAVEAGNNAEKKKGREKKKGGIRTFWSRKGLVQKMNPKITRRQGFPISGDITKTQRRSLNIRKRNVVSSFGLLLEKRKPVRVCWVPCWSVISEGHNVGQGNSQKCPYQRFLS